VHIDSLGLGALRHRDIAAIARDYNARQLEPAKFDGILARGFFSDGLLTIDYPRQRLHRCATISFQFFCTYSCVRAENLWLQWSRDRTGVRRSVAFGERTLFSQTPGRAEPGQRLSRGHAPSI
jgi:hypothetical protein